jgi:CBS domain-containing protein
VIDADGELIGVISALDIEERTLEQAPGGASAAKLAHAPRELHADDVLEGAVRVLSLSDDPAIPVLQAGGRQVVGWVTHRDILGAYHRERERLTRGSAVPPAVPVANEP